LSLPLLAYPLKKTATYAIPAAVLSVFEEAGYLAVEVTLKTSSVHKARSFLAFLERNYKKLYFRFHAPVLPEYDPFLIENPECREALTFLIDFIADSFGGGHLVLHSQVEPDKRLIQLSSSLVDYARRKGVILSLENLTEGWSADLAALAAVAAKAGFKIVLDIGHLNSSDCVRYSSVRKENVVKLVTPYLVGTHVYEYESSGHFAPYDYLSIGELLWMLIDAGINWWVIELEDEEEFLKTYRLIKNFLAFNKNIKLREVRK